jgi:hypothetical protein
LIIDVKHIPDTNVLSYSPQSGLTLGAAVPCHRIYGDATIAAAYPGLVDAFSLVGGMQIQGRGTVGGNLCNSSPAADTIPALIAHSAVAVIAGPSGTREAAVEDFCTGPGRNVLQNGELLVSLKIPAPAAGFGACYLRFIPRNEMDIAVVGVGMFLEPVSMTFITLPTLYPLIAASGYDLIWFGVVYTITMEIAVLTPPVGLNLYVIQGLAPGQVRIDDVVLGCLPFIGALVLLIGLILVFPEIALWLPSAME